MTAAQSADVIAFVPDLIAMARDADMMVIHVVVAFRPGHPEVSPRNSPLHMQRDPLQHRMCPRPQQRLPWRRSDTRIEKQKRQAVVAGDRGSQVQVNHFPFTANALAISQLTGILAVRAHDAAA